MRQRSLSMMINFTTITNGLRTSQRSPMASGKKEGSAISTLDDWIEMVRFELGLEPDEATQKTVLNLTRVVAHTVDRPAAPLTAYLLGLAVGGGAPLAE